MKSRGVSILITTLTLFAASSHFARAIAADMNGLMMSGGKLLMVEQGKPSTPIQSEMKLADGSTLKPDGTILRSDGAEVHLHDGDVIMPDGHIMHGGKAAPMCH